MDYTLFFKNGTVYFLKNWRKQRIKKEMGKNRQNVSFFSELKNKRKSNHNYRTAEWEVTMRDSCKGWDKVFVCAWSLAAPVSIPFSVALTRLGVATHEHWPCLRHSGRSGTVLLRQRSGSQVICWPISPCVHGKWSKCLTRIRGSRRRRMPYFSNLKKFLNNC